LVIVDAPALRHPHSVAFLNGGRQLVVTNAGANYFNLFGISNPRRRLQPNQSYTSLATETTATEQFFRELNDPNPMEGGPKGVAVRGAELAVCTHEYGHQHVFSEPRVLTGYEPSPV
jgi:hypothetical protein